MVAYSEPTVTRLEGTTRRNFLKRFLRETGLGAYGTATDGSTTTIIDTVQLKSSQLVAEEWEGGWSRISYDAGAAGAAPQGEIKAISDFAPSTGTITIDTGTAIAVGDEYELWKFPNPQLVLDFLDQVLKEDIFLPCWSILTYVPDGDMEQSATTDWTASGATVTKVSNTHFGIGKRHLNIVPATAEDYAQSVAIKVRAGDTYHLSALAKPADSQTARVALYTSAGVLIDYIDHDKEYPARLWKDITIPASTDSVVIRLIGQATTGAVKFDEVCFYSLTSRSLPLPWWIKNRQQVQAIIKLRQDEIESDILEPSYIGDITPRYSFLDEAFGKGQLSIYSPRGVRGPLVVFGTRNEEAYSNDHSDVKIVSENLLIACLAYRVFNHLRQQPNVGLLDAAWVQQQYTDWEATYMKEYREQQTRVEELFANPETWGMYF